MKIVFYADQSSVTEGEIIEVHWTVTDGENITLTLDNGFKTNTVAIAEASGSKKFRLNRSKGRTKLTLHAESNGKKDSKSIKVRVKKMPTTHAETIYEDRKSRNPFRRQKSAPKGKIGEWWNNQRNRFSYNWKLLTPKKQMAYTILTIMGIGILLGMINPMFVRFGEMALLVYLAVIIIKR